MRVKIIAEIGPNHNGKMKLAKKLILEAKKCGADYVKFQTFITEDIITKKAKKANYQIDKKNEETQFKMLEKLQLTQKQFKLLFNFCKKNKIKFLSTAFDLKSLKFINSLDPEFIKIPSGEITNFQLIKEITKLKKKVILSTGMSNLNEISKTYKFLIKNGIVKKKIFLLQCNTEYPTPFSDVNLNVLKTFKKKFGDNLGYSDHTMGIEAAIASVPLGAKIIEKHFTLNRKMKGPDHKASLEPVEFKKMVDAIRNIESALGKNIKKVTKSERKNLNVARKSIVAIKEINKGDVFSENNIGVKRPGGGLSPTKWFEILEKTSKKRYRKDDFI
jgi:N,N'-diacetyllegionaminate synthase